MNVRRAKGSASVPRLPFPAEKHIHLSCYCLQLTKSSGWFMLQEGSVSESPGRTLMCKVSLFLGEDFLVWPPIPSLLVHISAPFAHCCPYVCLCRSLHLRCFGNLWFSFLSLLSSGPCMHLHMRRSEDQKSWLLSDCQPKAFAWDCSTPVFTLCFAFSFVSGLRTPICCPKLQPISEVQMMENKVNPRSSY